jgi:DNA-binding CsgD family transcriptional regulator
MPLDSATNGLLTTLYAAPVQPENWKIFVAEVSRLCGLNKAALHTHDFQTREHRILAAVGDALRDAGTAHEYENWYWQFDEWTSRGSKMFRPGTIFAGAEIWPEESFLKSLFYNEFMKRIDIREMVVLLVDKTRSVYNALSVYRGPLETPLDRERVEVLEAISPHLQTALAMREHLISLESRISDLETAFDQLQTAVILLDAAGKPILVNQAARRICAQRDGLHLSPQQLTAQTPTENTRLRAIISRAIAVGKCKTTEPGSATLISRAHKRPLQIFAAPLISMNLATPRGAAAIVFISDPDQKPAAESEILHSLYGLTRAESRVAFSLLDGKSLAEIADSNGVRRETVRTQIKSALHKTGTSRQGQLIRLISRIPG